jgi:RimK family alpha-L-glutamate ligase
MFAWLIVNEFLNTNKFSEHTIWIEQAAKEQGIEMLTMTNAQCLVVLNSQFVLRHRKPDFVLFWDKDIRLAMFLESFGIPVFNNAESIANCDDKSKTHLILQKNHIPMPKTVLAPMTYPNIGYTNLDFLGMVMEELEFPIVVKECFGSFGAQVYLAKTQVDLVQLVNAIGAKPMLFQEFIKESSGKDIRLQVVGDEVVASMYRYSENGDFRANITNGGKMKPYEPSQQEIDLALQCCRLLNLTFGGVDLLFGKDNQPIVCEVNSNAHFKNIYDCTKVNTAQKIMEYIVKVLQ